LKRFGAATPKAHNIYTSGNVRWSRWIKSEIKFEKEGVK
jgi:hypothetical protein